MPKPPWRESAPLAETRSLIARGPASNADSQTGRAPAMVVAERTERPPVRPPAAAKTTINKPKERLDARRGRDGGHRLFGSDDFPASAKHQGAADLTAAAQDGSLQIPIDDPLPLDRIAEAHDRVDAATRRRVVLSIPD